MKIEVKGVSATSTNVRKRIEPTTHELWIGCWRDPATVLGEERALGNDVESCEYCQPLIEDSTHNVTMPCRAKKF